MRLHSAAPTLLLLASLVVPAAAQDAPPPPPPRAPDAAPEPEPLHLAQFAAGDGPSVNEGGSGGTIVHLLDATGTPAQSNAVAWDLGAAEGPRSARTLRCRLRVLEGGDGGGIAFLNTAKYGRRGPAPFVESWVEPNLEGSFAVGVDVHNPPNTEPFGPWGNYQSLPEREVSLHWDGRELVKRVAPEEFRGDWADVWVHVEQVCGGAEVTVQIGAGTVYDRYFVPGLQPYEARLAMGAGTRADATTEFDVTNVAFEAGEMAARQRVPNRVEIFNHVLTDNGQTSFEKEVTLPPAEWAFGRVILNLDIHDAGADWDEWDRNGHLFVIDDEGREWDIVPFITSYRTPCHWQVDVTHFRPWLAGKTRFRIAAGTTFYKNRGYMMSVSLDFHHGTPDVGGEALQPFRVQPLWHGTAHYRSTENHFADFFTPQEVAIDESVRAARIVTMTTGHSQIGEFTPSARSITFQGDLDAAAETAARFDNVLWKTDCYLNPNRPQSGTWKYSRAGWAPGDVVRPWIVDLMPHLVPGKTAAIRYTPEPYDLSVYPEPPKEAEVARASHVVRSYLVLYRDADQLTPAPALLITNVGGDTNASKAEIKTGDYLAAYDGRELRTIDDLRKAIVDAQESGKEQIVVAYYRGAERREAVVGPGKLGVNLDIR